MSQRDGEPQTVADRINAVMRATPPREGRRSRLGHISIEDFALKLGTTKQRVIDWRKGDSYPDPKNRERLAAVSGGRYTADDFKRPSAEEMQAHREELEERVASLERMLKSARETGDLLLKRVVRLEQLAGILPAPARAARAKRAPRR